MSSSTKPHAHAEAALAARDAKDARPDRIATEPTAKPTAHAAPPAPQPHPTDAKGPAASQNESVWQKGDGSDVSEWFAGIPTIRYDPAAPPDCTLVFRHYNAKEKVLGKSMAEWLRFSVCYWHSFVATGNDQFGRATIKRPWDDGTDSLDNHKRRMRAAFEFFTKLGSPFWTFHDRDIAPEGKDWATTDANLKAMTSLAKELQSKTGVKLLWGTANLFTHPRYANGAATNPDAAVFAHAAAQVKRAMDATHELGGQGFVFWMGRDGYQTLLTKCVEKDLLHYAQFLRMAVEYKAKIGFKGQIMIEPKPKEPLAHQYDYDASTVIGFLKRFGLDKDIKLNIEPNHTTLAGHAYEHDVVLSSKLGMLGSIDANTGDLALGWDTDQFPGDLRNCTLLMKAVLEMGGLPNGGLNFDCKVRRESIALDDLFVGHVGAFDMFARALKAAAVLTTNPTLKAIAPNRYASYNSEFGRAIESGKSTFEDCDAYARNNGEPTPQSGGQEKAEMMLNAVVFK